MSAKQGAALFLSVGALGLVFLAGSWVGYNHPTTLGLARVTPSASGKVNVTTADAGGEPRVDLGLFWQVWDLVQAKHVDRPADTSKLLYGAINGMLTYGMDDEFSAFLPPEINDIASEDLSGSFAGVGIELDKRGGELTIVAPLKDSPGDLVGLLAGDVIQRVDGADVTEKTLLESVQLIRGPIGTTVSLSIQRLVDDGTLSEFDQAVTRAQIDVKSVTSEDLGEGVYLISVHAFAADTIKEWDSAVDGIYLNSPKEIILDLRNNAGGYVDAAIHLISEFVPKGTAIIQDFGEDNREETAVNGFGKLYDIPVKVLINYGTASASEMVAGAIQDYELGNLYGVRTFGKGVIQEIFPITVEGFSSDGALRLVTSKWHTPKERWIQFTGLTPDVEIKTTIAQHEAGEDPVLEGARAD